MGEEKEEDNATRKLANLFQKEINSVATSRFRPAQGLFQLSHRKATLYADKLQPEHCNAQN